MLALAVSLLAAVSLGQPYGLVARADGSLVAGDRLNGTVVRISPAGALGVLARVPQPRDVKAAADGTLLVSSGRRILALGRGGRIHVVAVARAPLEGLAPSGRAIYAIEGQTTLVRFDAAGRRTVLARGLNGAHGILATRFGVVVCEAYAGRVRVFASGRLRTLARGLGNPSYAVAAPDGVYVTEFAANRVSEISRTGRVRRVADVLQPGPIARRADGALLVASLDGTITRIDPRSGATRRVYPR